MRLIGVLALALFVGCGGGASPKPDKPVDTTTKKETPKQQGNDVSKLNLLAGLERRVLENGLTILVKEDHRLPIATTVVSYRVGAVHEQPDAHGLAHFLEHMMFKGTDQLRKGEIDKITFQAGGFNNAYTTNDYTSYWFTVHSDSVDRFLQIEANRMQGCLLDRKEWESELEVVKEELNRSLDRPWGKLFQQLEPAIFKECSYHHPVLGLRKDLDEMKYESMVQFYKDHYGPNNATLVVVGDVKKEAVFARVKELFGSLPKVKETVPTKMPEPAQDAERRVDFQTDKSLNRLAIAFRSGTVGSDIDIQCDVLSMILSNGKDSRLHKRLVVKDRTCTDASTANDTRKYDGAFYVMAELQEKADTAPVEKAVLDELERLKKEPVGDRELQKAKNIIAANFVFSKEQQYNIADDIGKFEAFGCPDYLKNYLARIDAVTSSDLQRLAGSIFRAENRTSAIARARKDRAPRTMQQGGATVDFGEYYEFRLRNGLTLLVKPQKELPVISVRAYVDSGALYEDESKAGVAELLGRLLDQGTDAPGGPSRTAEQLAGEVEFTGSHLATSATGVSFKTLTSHEQLAYDIVRDALVYPTFPVGKVADMKQLQLSEIAAKADAPELVAQEMFFDNVYAGHPMHRPDNGTAESVAKLERADVVAHHKRLFRPDNTIIAVAGDVNPNSVLLDIRKRFAEWTASPTELPTLPVLKRKAAAEKVVKSVDTNQINYVLGHLSLDRQNPDYFALRVLEHIFCRSTGFADRLSKQVRDDKGYAYEVWGVLTQQADRYPGPFMIYCGTRKDKGAEAHQLILDIIDDLKKNGPEAGEIEVAKNFLLHNLPFAWQSADQVAGYMITLRRLNLGIDYAKRYVREVKSVTREDLIRVAADYLRPESMTTVIVGPVDKDGKVLPEEPKKEEGK